MLPRGALIQTGMCFYTDRWLIHSQLYVYIWCTDPGRWVCPGEDLYDDLQPPMTAADTNAHESRQAEQLEAASGSQNGVSCPLQALVYLASACAVSRGDLVNGTGGGACEQLHGASVVTYEHRNRVHETRGSHMLQVERRET